MRQKGTIKSRAIFTQGRRKVALYCALSAWMALPGMLGTVYGATDVGTTKEVLVKASAAEENAKYESQQTTIITKEEIAKKQAKSVEDIVFQETGVTRTVDAMGRVGVSIRGAEPRHTLILVDGQPVMGDLAKYQGAGDELQRLGTENVERIEIIQGAASAKYGSDAIGGVINVITNKPSKLPSAQFNVEGRRVKGDGDITPFSNYFWRADSGEMGKLRINIHGSKRDIMPVYAHEARRASIFTSDEDHGYVDNSLRYYGVNSNIGVSGIYDINKNNALSIRLDRYNEDLERYVKHSTSFLEPQVHYKRDLNRNNINLSYTGKDETSNWRAEANYTRTTEDDITLTSDYGKSTYEGKNTLNYVDNIDHKQWNIAFSGDVAANENHLLSYGLGFSREEGRGSRLRSAPNTYVRSIDPWDYDKSLAVHKGIPSSTVYNHSFTKNGTGVERWNKEAEWYNGDASQPNTIPQFTYEEYLQYLDDANTDSGAVAGPVNGVGANTLQKQNPDAYQRYQDFNASLNAANAAFIADYKANKEGRTDANGRYYPVLNVNYLPSYYYGAVEGFDSTQLKFNGAYFKEEYLKRVNQQTIGEAKIDKQYAYLQDTWQVNDDTILSPILRLDHSNYFGSNLSFNVGVTHNLNHNAHRRLKANVGTSYTEPGMGELFYNWEMYGSNITNATIGGGEARLGWYWVGNPNLKPEKSVNFDVSIEGESNKTSGKLTLFHNSIKNYISAYNTGYLMDFHPEYDEASTYGASKFAHAPDMIYTFKNIGKAKVTGLQLELKQKLNDHVSGRLGYTYLRALNKSDSTLPRELLDKPRHKVDIGLDFKDKKSGWSASIWGDYYIKMLDSNSISGGGNYMVSYIDPTNPNRSVIQYNITGKKTSDMYERKTYGIWNLMVQKQLGKDAMAYVGVDNLFNHRDDDRALNARVYRMGLNFKFGPDKDTLDKRTMKKNNGNLVSVNEGSGQQASIQNASSSQISNQSSSAQQASMEPELKGFIVEDFDTKKEAGISFGGDIRLGWDSHLGSDRPDARVTPTSYISPDAAKNLKDEKDHGFNLKVRVGAEARVGKDTNLKVVGSASGQEGIDSAREVSGSKGLNHQRLEQAEVTQHANKWNFSVGRLHEEFGTTGYWFGKEYDGARAVWTGNNKQVRIGYGDFKHSTGIHDSAYTHAVYQKFNRVPTVEEFLGITRDATGALVANPSAGMTDTVNFYEQFHSIRETEKPYVKAIQDQEQVISDLKERRFDLLLNGGSPTDIANVEAEIETATGVLEEAKTTYEKVRESNLPKQYEILQRMQQIVTKAYGSEVANVTVPIAMPELPVATYSYTEPAYDEEDLWTGLPIHHPEEHIVVTKSVAPGILNLIDKDPFYTAPIADPNLFKEGGRAYFDAWYKANESRIIADYKKRAETLGEQIYSTYRDYSMSFDATKIPADLADQIYRLNSLKFADSGAAHTLYKVTDSEFYPDWITNGFYALANTLEEADGHSRLPREALGRETGAVIPTEGVVLQRDVIPELHKVGYIQYRHQIGKRLGLTSWYLRSFGGSHIFYAAKGLGTESYEFDKLANIFGVGATYQLGNASKISFDYGQNRTDFGRFMNGGTQYIHAKGSSIFAMNGRNMGGNPHFWTIRLDIGQLDYNKPGSWSGFIDYKYFQHGSFFGGTGSLALPDRYLDGIKSFTFGGSYVASKNLVLEGFYTFGAKGIGSRDTLYGPEKFKLGNFARVQGTYRF